MATRSLSGTRTAAVHTNNIVPNPSFESAPSVLTAPTGGATGRWIDGTASGSTVKAAYGWAIVAISGAATAGFDNTVANSGTYSMKLSTVDITSSITAGSYRTNAPTAASLFELFPLAASTSYTLTAYIKTNNAATNSAFVDAREFSAAGAAGATSSSNKLSGTQAFTKVTKVFTTASTAVFGGIFLRNNVTGNISDAWFDDISLVPTNGLTRPAASGRSLI